MCSGGIRDATVYMGRPGTSNCRRGGRADTSQRPPKPPSNGSSRDTFRGSAPTRVSSRGAMCSPPRATMSIFLVRGQPLRSNEGVKRMRPTVPTLLSFNGGYVDTVGYLSLQGLFTAHVTGNFVTIGAALVFGTSGVVAKLLALPVFCIVIVVTRLISFKLPLQWPVLETMLTLKLLLLIVAAALAIAMGPFANGDGAPAIIVGMTLVSAMAIQNAVHRIHLGAAPPKTLMAGTTTQIMIDTADVIRGVPGDARDAIRSRLRRMGVAVISFAAGAAAGALLFNAIGKWCFGLPPLVAFLTRITAKSSLAAPTGTPGPQSTTARAH